MKQFHLLWLLLACGCGFAGQAQLQFVPAEEVLGLMGGGIHSVSNIWRNAGSNTVDAEVTVRLLQTTYATAVPISEKYWKRLRVLPQQTILESASIEFPAVKSETHFLIEWITDTHRVLGRTQVLLYPTHLLEELKLLVEDGDHSLGVLDPRQEIKPALTQAGVPFVSLVANELDAFKGRLLIIGPYPVEDNIELKEVKDGIARLSHKRKAIVWILSAPVKRSPIPASFYLVPEGTNSVVVARQDLVSDLGNNLQSQLKLIYLCEQALRPDPFRLSKLSNEP